MATSRGSTAALEVTCVGGGAAGLSLAIGLLRRRPQDRVTVLERDGVDRSAGFGVVFWDGMLAALAALDPVAAREVEARAFHWRGQVVRIRGSEARRPGGGLSIARRQLLDVLVDRARALGAGLVFDHRGEARDRRGEELVVAADGAASTLRGRAASAFGTLVETGDSLYVWLGTPAVFDAFTFAFADTPAGLIWFHAYGYADDASTVVVECPRETWRRLGLDRLDAPASLHLLAETFERDLGGAPLVAPPDAGTRLRWQPFQTVRNARWQHDGDVLAGDAAHTTHFSLGMGTQLAVEDALGLAEALDGARDLAAALAVYEAVRAPAVASVQARARLSARFFEGAERYADRGAADLALLMCARVSPALQRVPPGLYCRLHRARHRLRTTVEDGSLDDRCVSDDDERRHRDRGGAARRSAELPEGHRVDDRVWPEVL